MEEMNNNEVQNIEPTNNGGVKVLLIVLIIGVFALIGLLSYKMFVQDKKNNKKEREKVEEKTYDKIIYEAKLEDGMNYLYVDGKKVENIKGLEVKVEQFKDVLIVMISNPGPSSSIVIVDKDGNVNNLDYKEKERTGELFSYGPESYRIEGNNLYIKDSRQYGNGYIDWYCKYDDKSAIVSYEVKYEYLGNGKFSAGEVVNEKPISEVYKEELKTCDNKANASEWDSIANYIKKNSESGVIDYDNAFKINTSSINKKCDGNSFILTNNGLNVETKCVKSREDEIATEYTYNILAKNNKAITVNSGIYSCGSKHLYSNNNYIIQYYSGCSANGQSINIYNVNDGNEIYYDNHYDNNMSKPYLITYSKGDNYNIVFSKNKLYYVLADYVKPSTSGENTKCRLMMVDLSSKKFKETEIDSIDCYYYNENY